jgi:hypothetical protein
MKKIFLLLACLPFLLATTCEEDDINCTQEAKAGLNITVKDALTQDILSLGVTVIIQDGLYNETLEEFIGEDFSFFMGAWEREGTYTVTISKEGYQTFTSEPIVVNADVCHVIPQQVTVELQPN